MHSQSDRRLQKRVSLDAPVTLLAGALAILAASSCQAPYREELRAAEASHRSDPASAASHYQKAIELGAVAQGNLGLAQLNERLGNWKVAASYYAEALKTMASDTTVRMALARTLLASGQRSEAAAQYKALLDGSSQERSAALYLAALASTRDDAERALLYLHPKDTSRAPAIGLEQALTERHLLALLGQVKRANRPLSHKEQNLAYPSEIASNLATIFGNSQRKISAITLLRAVVAKEPTNAEGWIALAEEQLHVGQSTEARQSFEHVPGSLKRTPELGELKGRIELASGNPKLAVEAFKTAFDPKKHEKDPVGADKLMLLGEAQVGAKQYDAAAGTFQQILAKDPKHLVARLALGGVALQSNQPELAGSAAREILATDPKNAKAYALLVSALMAAKKPQEAEKAASDFVAAQPNDAEAHAIKGKLALELGKSEEARSSLVRSVELDPKLVSAFELFLALEEKQGGISRAVAEGAKLAEATRSWRGMLRVAFLCQHQKPPVDADPYFRKSTELGPNEPEAWRGLALHEVEKNAVASAISALEKAASLNPRDGDTQEQLAVLLERQGRKNEAQAAYRRCLESKPSSVLALNNLAMLLGASPQTLDEAIEYAERAQRILPKLAATNDTLGWLLVRRNKAQDVTRALWLLESAIQNQDVPEHRYHLALAQNAAGKRPDAIKSLRKSLESSQAFPGRADAERLLKELSQ